MFKNDFYSGWYLPTNRRIANVILHDFDLNFLCHKFEKYYLGNDDRYRKLRHMTVSEVDIRHRMAWLWILYSVTLTFICKVTTFVLRICYKQNAAWSGFTQQMCLDSHGARRGVALVESNVNNSAKSHLEPPILPNTQHCDIAQEEIVLCDCARRNSSLSNCRPVDSIDDYWHGARIMLDKLD